MLGRYRARHRSHELYGALTGFLAVAARFVVVLGGVASVAAMAGVVVALSWLIGEAWWAVNPLYGILWWLSLALVVPTAWLGRWPAL